MSEKCFQWQAVDPVKNFFENEEYLSGILYSEEIYMGNPFSDKAREKKIEELIEILQLSRKNYDYKTWRNQIDSKEERKLFVKFSQALEQIKRLLSSLKDKPLTEEKKHELLERALWRLYWLYPIRIEKALFTKEKKENDLNNRNVTEVSDTWQEARELEEYGKYFANLNEKKTGLWASSFASKIDFSVNDRMFGKIGIKLNSKEFLKGYTPRLSFGKNPGSMMVISREEILEIRDRE